MSASISVAMATYNGARYVDAQLASILAQLHEDDEIVVVDDASTDRTAELVESRRDCRIRLLRQQRNFGVRASFERALGDTRRPYVFLSDQDDAWLPGKRAALLAELQSGAVLALSDAVVIDAAGRETAASFMARRGGFRGSVLATLVRNRYLGCTMAFRRELLDDILPIPPCVPMHDMWIGALAAARGRVAYVDRPLIRYRRHEGNASPWHRAGLAQMLKWRLQLACALVARRVRGPVPPGERA
jgi:glycosyltransferase involved in cell wall biosynthesis